MIAEIEKRQASGVHTAWIIMITDFERFVELTKLTIEQWTVIYETAYKVGIYLMIGGHYPYLGTSVNAMPKLIRTKTPWTLFAMRISDQSFLEKTYNSREPYLDIDEVYIHNRKQYQKLKISREKGE